MLRELVVAVTGSVPVSVTGSRNGHPVPVTASTQALYPVYAHFCFKFARILAKAIP